MDENNFNDLPQLNYLLKKHEQLRERSAFKSFYQTQEMHRTDHQNQYQNAFNAPYYYDQRYCAPQPMTSTAYMNTAYVNPIARKPAIHINPRVQVKPSIYINPKMIPNLSNSQFRDQIPTNLAPSNQPVTHASVQNKNAVYVNPKIVNRYTTNDPEGNYHKKQVSTSINGVSNSADQSIAIPTTESVTSSTPISAEKVKTSEISKLLLLPAQSSTSTFENKSSTDYVIKSKTKLVKNNSAVAKNSNFSILTKRKLVRAKKSPKSTLPCSTSPLKSVSPTKSSAVKKLKVSPRKLVPKSQLVKINNLNLVKSTNAHKINWYNKVDKSVDKSKNSPIQKNLNNSKALVSIGGVMYKTTRNQLIRSSAGGTPIKRKRSSLSIANSQNSTTGSEKKLSKTNTTNSSPNKFNTSFTSPKSYKTNASNKVKQKSLQILRNKMRKNNQPCLMFQRFGFCANRLKGACLKVHDKNQVALCRNFLQGKCLLDNCPLSHDVGPEKMPTCKYFLEGCCARDGCPYLHVKVSSKSPICVEFLRGYCPRGNECPKRHINACPEFDKSGKCSKGKFCPYPHKTRLTETKRFKGAAKRKRSVTNAKLFDKSPVVDSQVDSGRKRYYDETSEDLSQKRDNLMKHIKVIKDVHAAAKSSTSSDKKDTDVEKSDTVIVETLDDDEDEVVCTKKRRPPIGPLPAYIPIE